MRLFDAAARRFAFALDPERAHQLSIRALKTAKSRRTRQPADPRLAAIVAGLPFPNPVGLAAGYDKNAEVPHALAGLGFGFGFVEVGTITPRAQPGNAKPRVFRLPRDRAVINRLGFNNEGHEAALKRLRAERHGDIVGVNIGVNADSTDRVGDYVAGIRAFYDTASYFTANVSSPNTPRLRELQERETLERLLEKILAARDDAAASHGKRVPVFLKIAPDLDERGLDAIAAAFNAEPADGLIISNTTITRENLRDRRHAKETGGLSGRPLFERSTVALAKMRVRLGPHVPIIGVGGVDSAESAAEKMRAGADLVQLYTGLVYHGPGLVRRIVGGLSAMCERENLTNLAAIRDAHVDEWAARRIGG
ncbi:quinone-dependent dihydroorotate dehydrogenase [Pararhizobium mangrovi]|uniref:quinone-dependent dihydroorotate dehydrogenase n=1 Tax=Pararhizobium mangrovi TaxID=2590452 RepID=UPI0015E86B25|nr:quinone-dependent dihydroorotate dehydrogenase [Pararhizobium mangrovi]